MKFNVLQQDIYPSLQSVARSSGARSSLPVLDNIFLSADENSLKLAATNLEIGVIKKIPVNVLEKGEITIPAKILTEAISSLQGQVEFESNGEILKIKSGKFNASINGISAEEFPSIPLSDETGIEFEKEVFLNCAQVLFAAAVDEGRPSLTGILTEVKKGSMDFVATDGFRLAHKKLKLTKDYEEFKSLIPKRTFEEVLRVISEEKADKLYISASENQSQMIFKIGETTISSRLIEGRFPDWIKIMPSNIITKVTLEKQEALKIIKLASVFAKNEASVLTLSIKKDTIIFKSSTRELGSQENEIEADIEGSELEIAFNSRFLHDAIVNCPSDKIILEFSGALSSTLIKPVGVEGLEFIVMPVRLN